MHSSKERKEKYVRKKNTENYLRNWKYIRHIIYRVSALLFITNKYRIILFNLKTKA